MPAPRIENEQVSKKSSAFQRYYSAVNSSSESIEEEASTKEEQLNTFSLEAVTKLIKDEHLEKVSYLSKDVQKEVSTPEHAVNSIYEPTDEVPIPVKQKSKAQSPAHEANVHAPARERSTFSLKLIIIILITTIIMLAAALAFALQNKGSGNNQIQNSALPQSETTSTPVVGLDSSSESEKALSSTEQVEEPEHTESSAVSDSNMIVIHNTISDVPTITVDGKPVEFTYDGTDAMIERDLLPDMCQVRVIALGGDNSFETAAVWFNKDYKNELSFDADYGKYVPCDEFGQGRPGDKMVDVLTQVFYKSFLTSINARDAANLNYSTTANTIRLASEIPAYYNRTYNLTDFSAVSDPDTIIYFDEGTVIYNASFRCIRTFNTGETNTSYNYRTIRLVWEDGVWKVDAFTLIDANTFNAHQYGKLP